MKKKTETFAELMRQFEHHFDLRTVFDDFLVMALACFSLNPRTGKSYDEELYLQTIEKYSKLELRHNFPKMLSLLIDEMEQRIDSSSGSDVLGEFYEQHFYRKGLAQYFTPWPLCVMMSQILCGDNNSEKPLRILEPCCGSGRMLITSSRVLGPNNFYYGIDIDATCVRMAAINMFLHGIFHSEVMCANALSPDDFRESYKLSVIPFGIFRITQKEESRLWNLHRSMFMTCSTTAQNNADRNSPGQLRFF